MLETLWRIVVSLVALAFGVAGCWTFGPGHELTSIFWVVLAIWLSQPGDRA